MKQFEGADQKNSAASKRLAYLEQQLREGQEAMEEETRKKLALQSRTRQLEGELTSMNDRLEEVEQVKHSTEKQIQVLQQQVSKK